MTCDGGGYKMECKGWWWCKIVGIGDAEVLGVIPVLSWSKIKDWVCFGRVTGGYWGGKLMHMVGGWYGGWWWSRWWGEGGWRRGQQVKGLVSILKGKWALDVLGFWYNLGQALFCLDLEFILVHLVCKCNKPKDLFGIFWISKDQFCNYSKVSQKDLSCHV